MGNKLNGYPEASKAQPDASQGSASSKHGPERFSEENGESKMRMLHLPAL